MNKLVKVIGLVLALLVSAYFIGPKPSKFDATFEPLPSSVRSVEYIENDIVAGEKLKPIKPGNHSQFYWADSAGKPTEYVVLYLHGFSASPQEGAPVHMDFAKRYGCNLYVPLLSDHGLVSSNPMLEFTGERFIQSAFDAYQVAQKMGKNVIIMATSTGCTAALYLASKGHQIEGLICYSPNIRVFDPKSNLLVKPWGLHISRLVLGGKYYTWQAPTDAQPFWDTKYRIESLIEMQRMLEGTMTESTFEKVTIPTFVGYYYKNEVEQDSVVSVEKIKWMYESLGSKNKVLQSFPNAGKHAISSQYFSKDIQGIEAATYQFAENNLGMKTAVD
jgi:esterase/lipase